VIIAIVMTACLAIGVLWCLAMWRKWEMVSRVCALIYAVIAAVSLVAVFVLMWIQALS
jgi:hypothetical protein